MQRLFYQEICHKLESETDYYINDEPITGIIYDLYENTQLKYEHTYVNAVLDGTYQTYYINGQLKEKGEYKKGKKVGLWDIFHDNGQKKKEVFYLYGITSTYQVWDDESNLITTYKSNIEEDGISTRVEIKHFYTNGKIRANISAEYDIILSKKEWDINGNLIVDYKFTELNADSLYI
jgi:antitoxin component YwqK of YwqJK toxin-antitoxin module